MRNIIPMELTDLNSSIDMAVRPTYGGLPEYGVSSFADINSFETNINYPLKKLVAEITPSVERSIVDFNGTVRSEYNNVKIESVANGGIHFYGKPNTSSIILSKTTIPISIPAGTTVTLFRTAGVESYTVHYLMTYQGDSPDTEIIDPVDLTQGQTSKTIVLERNLIGVALMIQSLRSWTYDETIYPKLKLGYSHPWAGGAGKNLIDGEFTTNASGTTSHIVTGYKLPTQGSTVTCSGTASGTVMNVSNSVVNYKNGSTPVWAIGPGQTKEVPDLSSVNTIEIYTTATYANKDIKLQIEVGSSATTFEPYSNICPINGYDEVVVGVAGKNLLDPATLRQGDYNGTSPTIRVSQNPADRIKLRAGETISVSIKTQPATSWYGFAVVITDSNNTLLRIIKNINTISSATFDVQSGDVGNYLCIIYGRKNAGDSGWDTCTVEEVLAQNPMVEYGSATAYEPYNGTTYTTAVNVWDEAWELGAIDVTTGQNYAGNGNIRSTNYIPVIPNTKYFLKSSLTNLYCPIIYYNSSKNFVSAVTQQLWGNIITTPQNAYYMRFYTNNSYGTTYKHDISVTFPASETGYIPYKGSTATQNYMDTFGHGVYGGTLDVTTGVLTIDKGMIKIGDYNWTTQVSAYGKFVCDTIPTNIMKNANELVAISSAYKGYSDATKPVYVDGIYVGGTGQIKIYDTRYDLSQVNDWKTAMADTQIVYKLATPQTVQLTEQEVETVCGQNNIWANSGQVYVEYHFVEDFEE